MSKAIVIFRKFNNGGDIIALFPADIAYPDGRCESYQHVGQHGAADYAHCIAVSKPAAPAEFRALQRELKAIGYELDVKKRFMRGRK